MTWGGAAPAVGAAVAVLLLPGLVVAAVAGVRGVLVPALAPVVSVAVVAGSAVVAAVVGMPFGVGPVVGATATAAGVVVAARAVGARRGGPGRAGDASRAAATVARRERRTLVAGLLGTVGGGVALAIGVARGMGTPDRWPQTFDAVFHLSAVDHVLRSGDGSSLTIGSLVSPDQPPGFYPAAWHDLAAVVVALTGAPVPVAANAVALAAAAVAWPLACVGLTRVALGPRPAAVAAAGVLSAGLTASPVLLTGYGTLWPNALATALLPAVLALSVDLVGRGPSRAVPTPSGLVLLLGAVTGLALAHPNAVVSLLVLGAPALLVGTWHRGARWRVGATSAGVAVAWLVLLSPAFDAQRGTSWPARERLSQAAGEWLALAPQRVPVPLVLALLTLLGCVLAWRRPRLRWLLAVHVTAGALFVLVAGSDGRLARMVSAAWWDDAFRLAALAGVAGVTLAALGLDAVVRWLVVVARARGRVAHVTRAGAGVLVAATVGVGGVLLGSTAAVVHQWYGPSPMIGPAEQALFAGLPDLVPPGERVIGDPWNGAALTGPLGGREAAFPHLLGRWGADRDLLADSLASVATRPDVCAALARLRVGYVVTGSGSFWSTDPRREDFTGLHVGGHPGFVEVARSGTAALWRVTACGS